MEKPKQAFPEIEGGKYTMHIQLKNQSKKKKR